MTARTQIKRQVSAELSEKNVEGFGSGKDNFCTSKIGCGGAVALGFGDILWFGVFFCCLFFSWKRLTAFFAMKI